MIPEGPQSPLPLPFSHPPPSPKNLTTVGNVNCSVQRSYFFHSIGGRANKWSSLPYPWPPLTPIFTKAISRNFHVTLEDRENVPSERAWKHKHNKRSRYFVHFLCYRRFLHRAIPRRCIAPSLQPAAFLRDWSLSCRSSVCGSTKLSQHCVLHELIWNYYSFFSIPLSIFPHCFIFLRFYSFSCYCSFSFFYFLHTNSTCPCDGTDIRIYIIYIIYLPTTTLTHIPTMTLATSTIPHNQSAYKTVTTTLLDYSALRSYYYSQKTQKLKIYTNTRPRKYLNLQTHTNTTSATSRASASAPSQGPRRKINRPWAAHHRDGRRLPRNEILQHRNVSALLLLPKTGSSRSTLFFSSSFFVPSVIATLQNFFFWTLARNKIYIYLFFKGRFFLFSLFQPPKRSIIFSLLATLFTCQTSYKNPLPDDWNITVQRRAGVVERRTKSIVCPFRKVDSVILDISVLNDAKRITNVLLKGSLIIKFKMRFQTSKHKKKKMP